VREQLEKRLAALQAEHESGQRAMAELQQKHAALNEMMLRISGAIQVLEEELALAPTPPAADAEISA
jgi:predicted nuclease with TOPRIM domain